MRRYRKATGRESMRMRRAKSRLSLQQMQNAGTAMGMMAASGVRQGGLVQRAQLSQMQMQNAKWRGFAFREPKAKRRVSRRQTSRLSALRMPPAAAGSTESAYREEPSCAPPAARSGWRHFWSARPRCARACRRARPVPDARHAVAGRTEAGDRRLHR